MITIYLRTLDEIKFNSDFLNESDVLRANRIINEMQRKNFMKARSFIKECLGFHLDLNPQEVDFNFGEHGKPYIRSRDNLFFNLSHSANFLALMVADFDELGIDIEFVDPNRDVNRLASKVFSDEEMGVFNTMTSQIQKTDYFYQKWCLKEAFLKSLGLGIISPMTEINLKNDEKQLYQCSEFGSFYLQNFSWRGSIVGISLPSNKFNDDIVFNASEII